ncbi:MAG: HAMP domain-containing sensor histidine kinase [Bacteroidota bacterium]|nr:HAMP domain-containing sensor histidine kinase [Bacteroidota bacterium]
MSPHSILPGIRNSRHGPENKVPNGFALNIPLSDAAPRLASKPLNLFKSFIQPVSAALQGMAARSARSGRPKNARPGSTSFASALAHEVRNPLSNIGLAVDMLRTPVSKEDQDLYLDIIMRGSARINDLVTGLLTGAHAGGEKPEKFAPGEMLDEALARSIDRIKLKNVLVVKEYTTHGCMISVDKDRMKIALTNIMINAIEAMPFSGKLALSTRSENGVCYMEIRDNGIGIGKEDLDKIFKPYFTTKANGLGLGLSTTLDILRSNKVKVVVESEKCIGTRFLLSVNEAK